MASTYAGYGPKVPTPQTEAIPGSGQVPNSAGGYAFAVDDWVRLERFLILGSEGGTYYVGERELTRQNAQCVERCLKEDGQRVVNLITEISTSGRAPKNEPALFALAMALSLGDPATKAQAAHRLPAVARIGTHLLHFVAYAEQFRGWGPALRKAVQNWYLSKSPKDLAYQLVKYQSRDKWSHRDVLRLAHPKGKTSPSHDALFNWAVKGWPDIGPEPHDNPDLALVWAYEKAKRLVADGKVTDKLALASLIEQYRLPREAVPTEALTEKLIWRTLLDEPMPMTAMIRNLATMTRVGLIESGLTTGPSTQTVVDRLRDADALRKARVHPVQVLAAMLTYGAGRSARGNNTWAPARQVVDALDAAFYASFGSVEPCGKRMVLALDVSGSMGGGEIAGVPGLTPRIGSAAMALITAATEPNYTVIGFTAASDRSHPVYTRNHDQRAAADGVTVLPISPRQRLDDVVKTISNLPFGATDCALPMIWALRNKVEADVFLIYTDNETWAGAIHPVQALRAYRQETGIPAKLIVVGMTATEFSIADQADAGMLDVVGFDTASPNLIADFARR